jgi:autotransporter-associated beta strand protein
LELWHRLKTSRRKISHGRIASAVTTTIVTFIASGAVGAVLLTFAPKATLNSVSMIARTLNFDSARTQETNDPSTVGPTGSQHRGTLTSALTDAGRRIFNQATGTNKGSPAGRGDKNVYSRLITNHSSGAGKSGLAKADRGGTIISKATATGTLLSSATATAPTNSGASAHTEREAAPSAPAADATWIGTISSTWSNLLNWTLGGPPGSGDTATFNNAGNGNTTLNLGTGVTVMTILFNTSSAAPYTIGSGAVGSQTLTLNDSGAITVNSTVTNNETINARIVLGTSRSTTSTISLTNNSTTPGQLLTVAGGISPSTAGTGTVTTKTLALGGSGNGAVTGIISGNGSGGVPTVALTKSGTGEWRLSGANTYSGTTTVNAGTLLINGNQSAATGAVTVNNSGTTLGGIGTIGGTVTVNSGANIAPGNGGTTTGILSTGALTLQSSSNFLVNINGLTPGTGYDRLNVIGTVSIGGSNLLVTVGTTLNIGETFLIVNNDLADPVSGTFAQGSLVTSGPYSLSINYVAGNGNDILLTVTAVPEPSTWIGGALALAALGYTQRRRFVHARGRRSSYRSVVG